MKFYDFQAKLPGNQQQPMAEYEGKVLLIVNTASKCGFTGQYEGLEKLYRAYKDQGFEVLAFPCNQFNGQEPGNAEEIKNFCAINYDVTFPLMNKIDVNGAGTDPLWNYLKSQQAGLMGSRGIKWNFTKFLVDRKGSIVARHGPQIKPDALTKDIERLLAA